MVFLEREFSCIVELEEMRTRKFSPSKYFKGLSKTNKTLRQKEIRKYGSMSWNNPKAYVGFQTNKHVHTRTSKYTEAWKRRFPQALSLEDKSRVTGVPLAFLQESFARGMAAWRTGHRPGATQQQWGYARVHSFLLKGKTYSTADSDIVRRAKKGTAARRWWRSLSSH